MCVSYRREVMVNRQLKAIEFRMRERESVRPMYQQAITERETSEFIVLLWALFVFYVGTCPFALYFVLYYVVFVCFEQVNVRMYTNVSVPMYMCFVVESI